MRSGRKVQAALGQLRWGAALQRYEAALPGSPCQHRGSFLAKGLEKG